MCAPILLVVILGMPVHHLTWRPGQLCSRPHGTVIISVTQKGTHNPVWHPDLRNCCQGLVANGACASGCHRTLTDRERALRKPQPPGHYKRQNPGAQACSLVVMTVAGGQASDRTHISGLTVSLSKDFRGQAPSSLSPSVTLQGTKETPQSTGSPRGELLRHLVSRFLCLAPHFL